jgi:hypothetical protein
MNYIWLTDFIGIQIFEATFVVLMTLMFSKINIKTKYTIISILICSVLGLILLPFGSDSILNRLVYLALAGLTISFLSKVNKEKALKVFLNTAIAIVIVGVMEFIIYVPILYILGSDISPVKESIYSTIIFYTPVRLFQYMICYITYMRLGGKYEKINGTY